MPAIKIPLKQLIVLFGESAGNEQLDAPVREFAARLTVLTAHVERVEQLVLAEAKARQNGDAAIDHNMVEMSAILGAIAGNKGPAQAPAETGAGTEEDQSVDVEPGDEEAEAAALRAKAEADAKADMAAGAALVSKVPNGKKSVAPGEAS